MIVCLSFPLVTGTQVVLSRACREHSVHALWGFTWCNSDGASLARDILDGREASPSACGFVVLQISHRPLAHSWFMRCDSGVSAGWHELETVPYPCQRCSCHSLQAESSHGAQPISLVGNTESWFLCLADGFGNIFLCNLLVCPVASLSACQFH